MRTITHGKSASFAVMGRANARYHTAGEAILGSNKIAANERTINVDNLLIADVAIYDLEDAMNHYDVRREYSKQLGVALAKRFDETTMRVAVLAARSSGIIDDEPGGSVIKGGATLATDGELLAEAVFSCSQTFDEKDVPEQERCLILRPAQFYLLNQTTKYDCECRSQARRARCNGLHHCCCCDGFRVCSHAVPRSVCWRYDGRILPRSWSRFFDRV